MPPIADMAPALRSSEREATKQIAALRSADLIDETDHGVEPHNWSARQYKSDVSTDRVKRFRKRFSPFRLADSSWMTISGRRHLRSHLARDFPSKRLRLRLDHKPHRLPPAGRHDGPTAEKNLLGGFIGGISRFYFYTLSCCFLRIRELFDRGKHL